MPRAVRSGRRRSTTAVRPVRETSPVRRSRNAATWFEGALAALRQLPESREVLEQAIDISIDLRNALNELGEGRRAFRFLEAAEQYADRLDDRRRLARVLVSMNSYLYMSGNAETAIAVSQRALSIATDLEDPALQAAIHHCLGQDHFARGDFHLAVDHFTLALEHMAGERGGRRELLGSVSLLAQHTRSCLAWALAELGERTEAFAIAEDAVRVAEESEHATTIMTGLLYQGLVCVRVGDPQRAIPLLERTLELLFALNLQGASRSMASPGRLARPTLRPGGWRMRFRCSNGSERRASLRGSCPTTSSAGSRSARRTCWRGATRRR